MNARRIVWTAGAALVVFGGGLLLAAAGPQPPAEPAVNLPLAIQNARVIIAPGQELERGTILIRDGRIVAVGADVALPPGTRVIDAAGQWAYAGFIDAFGRAALDEAKVDADAERRVEGRFPDISETPQVETVEANRSGVYARRRVEDLLTVDADSFAKLRSGGFTAGLLAPPQAIFGGSASLVLLGDEPLRASVLRGAVAQTASFERPERRAIQQRGGYPGTPLGVVAHARQTLSDAQWYADFQAYVKTHPASAADLPFDADLEQLLAVRRGERPLIWQADSADQIHRALDLAAEFKLPLVIAGGREAWKAAERLKASGTAVLLRMDLPKKVRELKPEQRELAPGKPAEANEKKPDTDEDAGEDDRLFTKTWQEKAFYPQRAYDAAAEVRKAALLNPQRLTQAGVTWAFATLGDEEPGETLERLREYVAAGLPADAALKALTVTPAELCGAAGLAGTLEAGKVANVTLLTAALGAEDAKLASVLVAGREFRATGDKKAGRDKRGGKDAARAGKADATPTAEGAASQPATQSASAPAIEFAVDWPIETDAERVPSFRTGGNVLLKNALVLTITQGDLANTSVLVKDGRIAAVGRDLEAPAGVRVVDLSGYVLMPGMFDPHSHQALSAVNEWSMSVTPEVRCADVIQHDDPGIYFALTGGVTGQHLMHGSANTIGGQNVIIKNRYGKSGPELLLENQPRTVKFALGENVKRPGMDTPRRTPSPRRFPGTRMGVEAVLRRALYGGREYGRARAAHEAAVAAGQALPPLRRDYRLEALSDICAGDIWINCHSYRADEILRLLDVAEEFGVRVAALHHVLEGYRIAPEIARHGASTATFADWWAYKVEAYDAVPHNAAMLLRAGVNSALKSDSGDLVRRMNLEAAKSMRYGGLTPNEALSLVTINAVRMFGLEGRLGSIEVGKDADIAVFNGHPLDTFARCVLTLVDGEAYFTHRDFNPDGGSRPAAPVREFAAAPAANAAPLVAQMPRPAAAGTPDPGRYVIENATIHPVSGPAIERGSVMIADGKIVAVAPEMAIPAEFQVIDARGLHVWPGIINAATNVGLQEIEQVGVTIDTAEPGTYQPDVRAVSAFNPHSAMIEVTRAEGLTTTVLLPQGPTVAGQAGVVQLDGWTLDEMLVQDAVALVVTLPGEPAKGLLEEDEPRGRRRGAAADPNEDSGADYTAAALRRLETFFENARLYAAALDSPDAAAGLRRDARYDAMIPYVRGQRPVMFNASGVKAMLEALTFAEKHELRPVIVGGRDAWKIAERLAARAVPVIFEGTFDSPAGLPGAGNATDVWDAQYRALAVLAQAGVQFAVAHRGADLAKTLPFDVGFAIAHGLDPDAAMRALTLAPAEILGLADRLGSIEPGKVANLIITTDHPCQMTGRVEHVFINGRPVSLESKHTRDAEKFAARPIPGLPPARVDLKGPPSATHVTPGSPYVPPVESGAGAAGQTGR